MSSNPAATASGAAVRTHRPPPPLVALVRAAFFDPAGRIALLGAAGSLALLCAMFSTNILHFITVWATEENYSHGFLVPLIALYFANEAARRGPIAGVSGTRLGVGLVVASILGRLATVAVPVGFIGDLSLVIGLAGIVALLFGRDALRRFGFAIGFLVFMIPLPIALYSQLANPLQFAVSQVATTLLNLARIPALCEGNLIMLPGDNTMFVAEACSGMRQLTGFLALTTAWAYLVARPAWYRTILIVSAVPIAMTANVIRVTLTGAITYHVDPRFASGAFHTAEGLLMMAFGLSMLYAGCTALDTLLAMTTRPGPNPGSHAEVDSR